jgi:hypothetical protein
MMPQKNSFFLFIVSLLMCAWGFKNWGFHNDEVAYLHLARYSWTGDAIDVGKPVLAFIYNRAGFLIINTLGLGSFYPYVWQGVSTLLFVASIFVWLRTLKLNVTNFWLLGCAVFVQPLSFFILTNPMMEVPLCTLLTLFIAVTNEPQLSKRKLFAYSGLATLMKMTSVPVFGAWVAASALNKVKLKYLAAVILGIVAGLMIHKIPLKMLGAGSVKYYDIKQAFSLSKMETWATSWGLLLGPVLLFLPYRIYKSRFNFFRSFDFFLIL